MTESQEITMPPYRVAFVIDGVVQDVINTDARLAAIFLSQPTIVDITNHENSLLITVGSGYDPESNTFTESELANEQSVEIAGEGPGNVVVDDEAETIDSAV